MPGEVVDVEQTNKEIRIMVKTKELAKLGDKLSGRHGEKGVISLIIPDSEMPVRKSDGKPIDMIVDPAGIPGRVNPGQVLEMAAGKIAEKTGKPYLVNNFEPGVNYTALLAKQLDELGLPNKEEMYNLKTGQTIPEFCID